ncbi:MULTISPECIES: hypothetical protein [unclassified Mycobacterium]|uniref:hypothetical protein n=1 Tax=unclassified Mycobacterium TaxID=2642494 RepID=UPI0029C97E76|nr:MULTISPECIES: hypothetical protein [unclassified Mycobacterium]
MGLQRDVSPYGSQTVTGPGWPNVEEEQLAEAAAQYEAFAAKLTGSVVPQQTSQLTSMTGEWLGGGGVAAAGEATQIIGGHEANAAQAAAIALKLHAMEAAVIQTKTAVNATAMEVQTECMAIQAMPVNNTAELIQSRIKMGLSQNIALVNAGAAEVANATGSPPTMPNPGTSPGSQQAMQMMGQMAGMAAQLPGQLMGMVTQAPQQLMQPLQQLAQPLQSLTSMFGGKGSGAGAGASPFAAFSNHPLAGGSGAGGGAGLVKAASVPGAGGSPAQTPMMAKLVGTSPVAVGMPAGASSAAVGGMAPVAAGGGMGGPAMMGQRGEGNGGATASLSPPPPLEYDLDEGVEDDW